MEAVKNWHRAMKSKDAETWDEFLGEDVVFYSLVVFTLKKEKNYNDVSNGSNKRIWECRR